MIRIIRKIYLLFKACIGAFYFEYAWDLLARKKIEKAEKQIQIGEKFIKKLPYEYLMMKGHIKFHTNKDLECIALAENAWKALDEDNKLSQEDSLYLKSYISTWLEIYKEFFDIDLQNIELIPIESIDLQKVSKHWIKRFPSRDHPDWYKYAEQD